MRILRIIVSLLFFLDAGITCAQDNNDSLEIAIAKTSGEKRLELIDQIAIDAIATADIKNWGKKLEAESKAQKNPYWEAMGIHHQARASASEGNYPESLKLRRKTIQVFQSINRQDKMARQYLSVGNLKASSSEYDSALYYYQIAERLALESSDSAALAGIYLNIGTVHHDRGSRESELNNLFKAYKISKALNDSSQLGTIIYDMAVFYIETEETKKGLELIDEVMSLYKSQKNYFGEASVFTLLAKIQFEKGNVDSTLYYLDRSIELYEQIGEKSRIALIIMNQGNTLGMAGRWNESIVKLELAYKMFAEIGDQRFAAITLQALSASEEEKGDIKAAIDKLKQAIQIADEIGAITNSSQWYQELAGLYKKTNQDDLAYQALKQHIVLKDSIYELNKQGVIQDMESKYQNEKKQLEIENLEQERAIQTAQLQAERSQRIVLIGGLLVALLLSLITGYAFIQKRKDNRIISAQKLEVEQQRDEVKHQKLIVEEKNREITDSITYAKRIQEAILPPLRIVKEILKDSFILYLPKDIVAGDFYWMETSGDTVLFAAADCTGHGVPGAMVSVVCSNALNRSVREYGLTDPGKILDKCRELVIEEFEKSDEDVQDGMDISLCALNSKTNELKWAGAYNPLWIVTSRQLSDISDQTDGQQLTTDNLSLYEIKANKQPIGKYASKTPFTTHNLKLESGDSFYVFSDGFSDQFGGDNGKKYKSSNFKKRLVEIAQMPMDEQRSMLMQEFEVWRGDMEQIDDVCVIGVRV